MKITLVGPGLMPIPPTGWGAIEILVWDYKQTLEELGHEVQIVNTTDLNAALQQINSFDPDFVHIQYDDYVHLYPHIKYPCAVTTHFAYLERPELMGPYKERVFEHFSRIQPNVFGLSEGINKVYEEDGVSPSKLYLNPNGVNLSNFRSTMNPEYPERSVYLATIDHRKRQFLFQDIESLWFAGNIRDDRFDKSKRHLGEWDKSVLYDHLTEYGNLVLLSDGEAHPLVCMEAFAAGLGVVVCEWGAANLDLDREFITVIPESKINDTDFVEDAIIKNREYSITHREEILEYAKQFDWKQVLQKHYLPNIEKLMSKKKIAINFIGTGNYLKFFPRYYETFMEYFAPECDKDFFVFTDGEFDGELPGNVKIIRSSESANVKKSDYGDRYTLTYHSIGGLKRFGEIKKIRDQLSEYDWYVYFDADMHCLTETINYEDFFDDSKTFFGVQHPCQNPDLCNFTSVSGSDLPFERNTESLACVTAEEQCDDVYLQGCVWGGKVPQVLDMIEDLDKRIIKDLKKEIMTFAHDESYLNRYRNENFQEFHVLSPAFAKPGDMPDNAFKFSAKIIHSPSDKKQILNS